MASSSKQHGGSSGGATATSALSAAGDHLLLAASSPRRSSSDIALSLDDVFGYEDYDNDSDTSRRFGGVPTAMLDCYSHHAPAPPACGFGAHAGTRGRSYTTGVGLLSLQSYGALRKGGPVALLSSRYGGYALSAALSGYFYVALALVIMRFPPASLGLAPATFASLRDLLSLQWSVVLLLGLLSDSFAPFGRRRNAYILGGWALVAASCCALFALLQFGGALSADAHSAAVVACVTGAMLFLVVLTNATDIRIVELAQQDELATRGQLVGTYQILRIGAQVAAHALVKLTLTPDPAQPLDVQLLVGPRGAALVALHLAVLALVPLPFLAHHAFEPRVSAPQQRAAETCRQFLRSAQQKAIWQLVAFNCVLYFFSFLESRDVARALARWTAQPPRARLLQAPLSDLAFVLVLAAWRSAGGVNAHWRKATAAVVGSWALVYAAGNALVALDVARAQGWLPVLMSLLKAAFRVLLLFSAFVPTIEVAQAGSEGTIYGLLSSFQSVVKILGAELADAVTRIDALALDLDAVRRGTPHAGAVVFRWVLVVAALKLLALLALFFCPRQKLDAQQRRIYGGYSKRALGVFLALYAVSFPYATYTQYARLRV
ncbi:hypothetical protein PybrP1_000544 [[Pythium] brassicae (nom. inval.)]|nr:hypothetical protein PybrP1_000544 [[Pythium] brassicae (nom. inval.)]